MCRYGSRIAGPPCARVVEPLTGKFYLRIFGVAALGATLAAWPGFEFSVQLMRASRKLPKPMLHCIEDQIYPPIHAKLSVNRA